MPVVVDIRYHLASIVAVFLALGLGILVGMSLSDGDGQREEWLRSLEDELRSLRQNGERTAAMLREAGEERDRYKAFAGELSHALTRGLLEDERAAVVVFGAESKALEKVEALLERAGAPVVRKVVVAPEWSGGGEGGGALGAAITGGTEGGSAVDSPHVNVDARSGESPTVAVFLLSGSPDRYRDLVREAGAALDRLGVKAAAVIEERAWAGVPGGPGVPYVAHFDTPMGEVSLAALLDAGGQGGYGVGEGLALWPEVAFK